MVYPPPFYFPLAYLFITPGVIFLTLISSSVQPEDGVGGQAGDGSRKDDFGLPPGFAALKQASFASWGG